MVAIGRRGIAKALDNAQRPCPILTTVRRRRALRIPQTLNYLGHVNAILGTVTKFKKVKSKTVRWPKVSTHKGGDSNAESYLSILAAVFTVS